MLDWKRLDGPLERIAAQAGQAYTDSQVRRLSVYYAMRYLKPLGIKKLRRLLRQRAAEIGPDRILKGEG